MELLCRTHIRCMGIFREKKHPKMYFPPINLDLCPIFASALMKADALESTRVIRLNWPITKVFRNRSLAQIRNSIVMFIVIYVIQYTRRPFPMM